MHAASSHWKHIIGTFLPLANLNTLTLAIAGLHSPLWASEHASSQVPQPMHFSGEVISIFSMPHSSLYFWIPVFDRVV
jgi:hypothetical protein